jgi:hypothetical protein
MRTNRCAALVATLLLVALTGCSTAQTAASATATSTAKEWSSSTTSTAEASTVRQFASAIAPHESWFRDFASADKVSECYADMLNKSAVSQVNSLTCSVQAQTAPLKAKILLSDLKALGVAPSEVASLVQRTKSSLTALGTVSTAECQGKTLQDIPCSAVYDDVQWAMKDVIASLDSWKPYS